MVPQTENMHETNHNRIIIDNSPYLGRCSTVIEPISFKRILTVV